MATTTAQKLRVETDDFSSAETFLRALSPQDPYWRPFPLEWVFRGHADHKWLLVPTALRNDTRLGYRSYLGTGRRTTHGAQVAVEYQMLEDFITLINHYGHQLPPDVHSLWFGWNSRRELFLKATSDPEVKWPPQELKSILALAQHYGIPTRLLDWSKSSYVAAYFAAERAAVWLHDGFPDDKAADKLCVWACNAGVAPRLAEASDSTLQFMVAPQEYNPNMRAQRGLFTLHIPNRTDPEAPPIAVPLDELLGDWSRQLEVPMSPTRNDVVLRKMTLPLEEAPVLLGLLTFEGITPGMLNPTLYGVVQSLQAARYRSRPPPKSK